MKKILLGLSVLVVLSCKNAEETTTKQTQKPEETKYLNNDTSLIDLGVSIGKLSETQSDHLTIKKAGMKGSTLLVKVQYGGGCEKHGFGILGSKTIMKSFPPQRNIKLLHENHDDHCRALLTKNLKFDIEKLLPKGNKKITLHLTGWKEPLTLSSNENKN